METVLRVLSEEECSRIHEESLRILAETGVRVDTARGRQHLRQAGAFVDEDTHSVRMPKELVEECLRLAPREFSLGSRRPGRRLAMNSGQCGIVMDGGAVYTYDAEAGARRPATRDDWYLATRLGDCLEGIDVYWSAIEGCWGESAADTVAYWKSIFQIFSKHVQEATRNPLQSRWMTEVLQVVFGDRDEIARNHPVSFLLCPASPLIIEGAYTDAYLELVDWDIPVAVMSMPLFGLTSPAALISELILVNCETLAMLCLVQSAAPGTPFIYAAVPAIADMRSGRFGGGEVEHSLLGAAVTEIARMYHLPCEATTGGSDQNLPCIQAGYERALNYALPVLARPDLLVGPGLLGGSTIFSAEQMLVDVEIIQRCKRLSRGIGSQPEKWLGEVISTLGVGGNYLTHRSTRDALRNGEVYSSPLGWHGSYDQWVSKGSPGLIAQISENIQERLAKHEPLPLPEDVERELTILEQRARFSGQ